MADPVSNSKRVTGDMAARPAHNRRFPVLLFDQQLVAQGGKLFRRETRRTGVVAWELVKPPQPGL